MDFGKLPGVYCNGLQVFGRAGELVWEQCVSSSVVEGVVAACGAEEPGAVSLVGLGFRADNICHNRSEVFVKFQKHEIKFYSVHEISILTRDISER